MEPDGIPHLRQIDRPIQRDLPADPKFTRASEVIADRVAGTPLALMLGVPFGRGSLSGAKCELTPAAVRGTLPRFSSYSSDTGVDLPMASVLDAGDLDVAEDVAETQTRLAACIAALPAVQAAVVGGDNSITVGAVAGMRADALITFDAHHDVRDGISNGSPVRQILEAGMPGERIVQIGIHGFANSREYTRRAAGAGIAWVSPDAVRSGGIDGVVEQALARITGAGGSRVFVDVDLDCLDRAFSPGTAASMPGGLWPSDLVRAAFLLGASPVVCGIDLTEVDPSVDVGQITVRTACAVLVSYLSGVATRWRR